jgi:site-specific recombinase XerD
MSTLRQQMTHDPQVRGLSDRTQEAYLRAVRQLADYYQRSPDRLEKSHIRKYFLYIKKQKCSSRALKIAYSGIKLFFTRTVSRQWQTSQKLRVPRQKTLPDVLTVDEVRRIIPAVRTIHNQTYLWTVYSLGLRFQEGLNLQIGDIDNQRMLVHVRLTSHIRTRRSTLRVENLSRSILRENSTNSSHSIYQESRLGESCDKNQTQPDTQLMK